MGLYGMTSGQALGQGTFTFDRIVPNRYLLDSRVNNDSVMPGRYALIEYDRPIAVIKNVELILNTTNNTYELPDEFSFEYNINSKETYKQFPVNNEKSYDIIPVDENGKISMTATATFKIFICIQTPGQETTYNYFYANIPEQSSALLTKANFTLYEPNKPDQDGEEYEYNPLTPNEFNKIVDKAYVAKDTTDDIDLNTFELWDSTAWIKVIDKEKSEFKYIKIADLNVLTPTFIVDEDTTHEPTTTFSDTSGTFNAPSITQGKNASFIIKFPPPMDINVAVETTAGTGQDMVASNFKDKNTKKFTFVLPSIGNAVNNIKDFIKVNSWPDTGEKPSYNVENYNTIPETAGTVWQAIKDAYASTKSADNATSDANDAALAANQAASAANTAAQNVGDNIKNVFSSEQVIVDWSISQPESAGANVKIPIAKKPTIISANDIVTFWNQNS